MLSSTREGIALTRETFYRTEEVISSAVQRGQHIYHAIMANHLPVSNLHSRPNYNEECV